MQKIFTKEILEAFKKQGDTSEMEMAQIRIIMKLFNPLGAGTWYIYDRDPDNPDILWCFANLGDPMFAECGTVSLSELMSLRLPLNQSINRDQHFPVLEYTLEEVYDTVKRGDLI